jgi:hypothetical protein
MLGGVFDILNNEFMMKLIIYPNMQMVIKLVSRSDFVESMLHNLVFILSV